MITYEWKISSMKHATKVADKTSVLTSIYWRLRGINGNKFEDITGVTDLPTYEEGQPFVEFENVNKDVIIGWVKDQVGEDTIAQMKNDLTAILT